MKRWVLFRLIFYFTAYIIGLSVKRTYLMTGLKLICIWLRISHELHGFRSLNLRSSMKSLDFWVQIRRFHWNPWISLESADFNEIHNHLSDSQQGNIVITNLTAFSQNVDFTTTEINDHNSDISSSGRSRKLQMLKTTLLLKYYSVVKGPWIKLRNMLIRGLSTLCSVTNNFGYLIFRSGRDVKILKTD